MIVLKRLTKIAFRNVFRNKRRSLLTLMILMIGSAGLLVVGGYFQDILEGFKEQFIHSQTGHIQVSVKGYFDRGTRAPFDYLIADSATLQKEIEANPKVSFTVPRIKFGGILSNEKTSVAVIALGTDPIREKKMGNVRAANTDHPSTNIIAGKDLSPEDPKGILLGKGLKEALGLKVGDSVYFLTTQESGSIDGDELKVRGVFETVIKDFDDRSIKMNLSTAQSILDVPDQVHSLLVLLKKTSETNEVRSALRNRLKGYGTPLEWITWEEQGRYYRQGKALLEKIYSTVQLIICIIFIVSIANVINMNVFERMHEYGTMMAIGNSRGALFLTIFLEASILGVLGGFLGAGFGIGMAKAISAMGIEMPPPPQGTTSYFAMIALTSKLILETFFITVGAAIISSLLPGYRACHFKITKALGYV